MQVWDLLSILETNRIAYARFTDEIEFYLPKYNAVLFLARIQEKKIELRNMHFNTVYVVICVTGVCA